MTRNSSSRSNRSISHGYLLFLTLFSFLVFTSLLVFPLHEGHCAQVTLAWDPDSVSDLAGYKIYYGTASGNYQWNVDAGNVTTYTLSDLTIGATYYAAATAYTTSGLESTYSNEVMFTVPSGTNTTTASAGGGGPISQSGQVVVQAVDFNGYLKTDLAVWRPGDGNWYIRNSATGTVMVQQWGQGSLGICPFPGITMETGRRI